MARIVPRFLGHPARILVALPTELSRLLGAQGWIILKLILGDRFGSANLIKSVQGLLLYRSLCFLGYHDICLEVRKD
jgi:hypothetical protein